MGTQSIYLEKLNSPKLYLSAPLPLEIEGEGKNWVVTWVETRIESEGASKEEALRNMHREIVKAYQDLDSKYRAGSRMTETEDRVWIALCHYISDPMSSNSPEDKGPHYG